MTVFLVEQNVRRAPALFPAVAPPYYVALGLALLADVAVASAWALFSGPTRYLSLAAAAFCGAGAYPTAVVAAWSAPIPILACAAAAGLLALRLRGPYFANLTFGLSELIRHLVIRYESRVTGAVGQILVVSADRRTLLPGARAALVLKAAQIWERRHYPFDHCTAAPRPAMAISLSGCFS